MKFNRVSTVLSTTTTTITSDAAPLSADDVFAVVRISLDIYFKDLSSCWTPL